MLNKTKSDLATKFKDRKLAENFFFSYGELSKASISRDPVGLLQNTGLFVESCFRIIEHLVFGTHTPLNKTVNLKNLMERLEKASGPEGLRIHAARLCRAAYDFRSRKKSVHLKEIDPQEIDASLVFNIATWISIEILKESGVPNAEKLIKILSTRRVPLVQSVGNILRTTDPKLSGPQRILLLLYASPDGLTEEELLAGTETKIKNKNHLKVSLKSLKKKDLIHQVSNLKWVVFGRGLTKTEALIEKFGPINN